MNPSIKTFLFFSFLSLGLSNAPAIEIVFEFTDIDSYRDFSYSGSSKSKTLKLFKSSLERNKEAMTSQSLPEDSVLKVNFLDIDMAGDIQPWRNPDSAEDIRYIEDGYPPRFKIEYTISNKNGVIIKTATEEIADMNFLWDISLKTSDPFFYEIKFLTNWVNDLKVE